MTSSAVKLRMVFITSCTSFNFKDLLAVMFTINWKLSLVTFAVVPLPIVTMAMTAAPTADIIVRLNREFLAALKNTELRQRLLFVVGEERGSDGAAAAVVCSEAALVDQPTRYVLKAPLAVGTTWQAIEARRERDHALFETKRANARANLMDLALQATQSPDRPVTPREILDRNQLNDELEDRVQRRTLSLEQANGELQRTDRKFTPRVSIGWSQLGATPGMSISGLNDATATTIGSMPPSKSAAIASRVTRSPSFSSRLISIV